MLISTEVPEEGTQGLEWRVACFTGHRNLKGKEGDLRINVNLAIRNSYKEGYRAFISGMALGFDTLAAIEVLRLRKELGIYLVCALPFRGQEIPWNDDQKSLYYRVLSTANEVHYVDQGLYAKHKYFKRDRFMVDNSQRVIAAWNGLEKGGTYYTVKYAKDKEVINLW